MHPVLVANRQLPVSYKTKSLQGNEWPGFSQLACVFAFKLREMDYLVEFHEQMMLVRLKQNDDKKLMEIIEEKLQLYLENKDI